MSRFVTGTLGLLSLLAVFLIYLASSDISENLSSQGCRMSWMSPSYVQQANFNKSWTPLSNRYSLWLYREVGWDPLKVRAAHMYGSTLKCSYPHLQDGQRQGSLPVLFIPGNAGSSHQVRSIASSATRQYFSSPHVISENFPSGSVKPLDFYAGM